MLKFILFMVLSASVFAGQATYDKTTSYNNSYFVSDDALSQNQIFSMLYNRFEVTGKGSVNPAAHQSYSIWSGNTSSVNMRGTGSAHGFTAIGQLYPASYNELGGFQAELTNMGSVDGTISGTEMLLKDSPDRGSHSFPTKLQPIVSRIAKYNAATKADSFYASSEGSVQPDSIITGNPGGSWKVGIDFGGQSFTSGYAAIFPNNFALAWRNISGSTVPVFSYNQTGTVYFTDNKMRFVMNMGNGVFTSLMELDKDGISINVNGTLKHVVISPTGSCGSGLSCLAVQN